MKSFKTKAGVELPILNLRGKDYLQVAHRLVWFREEHPDWGIETSLQDMGADACLAQAFIKDPTGRIIATAHKVEDRQGFSDFREKCETGAIGRALALCGYGTQFCAEELDEGARLADFPLGKPVAVSPDQPYPQDGVPHDMGYRIPFGKYKARSLEEIGPHDLRGYVDYLEKTADKKGTPITGQVLDFVNRATEYIGSWENSGSYVGNQHQ